MVFYIVMMIGDQAILMTAQARRGSLAEATERFVKNASDKSDDAKNRICASSARFSASLRGSIWGIYGFPRWGTSPPGKGEGRQ